MQYELISDTGASRLILIFAGWGMDSGVFASLSRPGYDVMVVWDYTNFHIDWSITDPYDEVCILAWSMGVFAATETTQAIDHKVTRRIAVNGTPTPVNDDTGIPEAVFHATLEGLSDTSVRKFYRRMCDSADSFRTFMERAPQRSVESLHGELASIYNRTFFRSGDSLGWDLAVVGRNDLIFPRHNQRRAWERAGVAVVEADASHYLDFELLINRYFIDKSMAQKRFGAAVDSYESQAAVQADAIDRLMAACNAAGLTPALKNAPDAVLEIGSGSGLLTRRLARLISKADFEIWDLSAPCPAHLPDRLKINFCNCDAELQIARARRGRFNFIFTASTVQWFNSPARFLKNAAAALADGGVLALTTYTRGNMHEISDITGLSLPLLSPRQWIDMASAHFEVVHSQAYERDLDFESPLDVLRHMKVTGVNGLTSAGTVSASEIIRRYPMRLDGRYHLTYCPFILILRKK